VTPAVAQRVITLTAIALFAVVVGLEIAASRSGSS
jgi:hypothetical protein